jgi:hypothetical protein
MLILQACAKLSGSSHTCQRHAAMSPSSSCVPITTQHAKLQSRMMRPSSLTAATHVLTTRCPVPIIHRCSRSPSSMRILKACAQALWQQPHMRQQPCCFVPIIHQCSKSPHSMQSFPACTKLSDCSNTLADNRAALSPSSLVSQKPPSMLSFTAGFQALQQQQRHAALFPLTACA